MALSLASFVEKYPEFAGSDTDQVNSALAEAEEFTSDLWPTSQRDSAVALRTAMILARSPAGRNARRTKNGKTNYEADLEMLTRATMCLVKRM